MPGLVGAENEHTAAAVAVTAAPPSIVPPVATPWYASTAAAGFWFGLLAAGLAWDAASFGYRSWHGLGATGLSNTVTWGAYIVTFMFLVGVSAGGQIVVAGSELIGSERLASPSRLAVLVSGTAVLAAAVSILTELGRPGQFWRMLAQPNWTSPLVWDMAVITIYLTIAASTCGS